MADAATLTLWRFDEGSRSSLYDASSNSNDRALSRATWSEVEFPLPGPALPAHG